MKTFSSVVALALLLTLPAQPAAALNCASAATTADMVQCADIDYRAADKALNQGYAELKRSLDEPGAKLLLESQRAWLKFRDANCAFAADAVRGGTMASLVGVSCITDMTVYRTRELSEAIKQRQ